MDELEARRLTRPWFKREDKFVRKQTNRQARHKVRQQMRRHEYDTLPEAPRTEGWITW
jgi:hypothetical protein